MYSDCHVSYYVLAFSVHSYMNRMYIWKCSQANDMIYSLVHGYHSLKYMYITALPHKATLIAIDKCDFTRASEKINLLRKINGNYTKNIIITGDSYS